MRSRTAARPSVGTVGTAVLVLVLTALSGCATDGGDPAPTTTAPGTSAGTPTGTTTSATPTQTTTSTQRTTPPIREGFEDGLGAWAQDSHVPDDPNNPGSAVAWEIRTTRDPVQNGSMAAAFFLDGRQDDGTIWIERLVTVPAGSGRVANVSVWAWSPSESFNTRAYLVSHLGPDDPQAEEDFPAPGENSARDGLEAGGLREVLDQAAGWVEYTYTWEVPDDVSTLYLAVGISVVWESEMTFFIDDVHLTID